MILAGDIGGTKTSLALFERGSMQPHALETFPSGEHTGLDAMLAVYLDEHRAELEAAAFGVAGPVDGPVGQDIDERDRVADEGLLVAAGDVVVPEGPVIEERPDA